jgi:hypothetical protein
MFYSQSYQMQFTSVYPSVFSVSTITVHNCCNATSHASDEASYFFLVNAVPLSHKDAAQTFYRCVWLDGLVSLPLESLP